MEIETCIAELKKIDNPQISDRADLDIWKENALTICNRIFGSNNIHERSIQAIEFKRHPTSTRISFRGQRSKSSGGGNNSIDCKKRASALINTIIREISAFGLPNINNSEQREVPSLTIVQSQSQNQNQSINIDIVLKLLKQELKDEQFKDIEDIVNGGDDIGMKKGKIIDKLKNFGSDVATNIIANILTNPSLYS